jgi:hypothetical protein
MSKFIISLTRDTSENGYLAIEAEGEDAAKRKYLDGDYSAEVVWSEGDWVGDSEVLEVIPYEGNEELLAPLPLPAGNITPQTRVEVLVEGEEPDVLTVATLIYDQFTINSASRLNLVEMMDWLARGEPYQADYLTGYSASATIRLKAE